LRAVRRPVRGWLIVGTLAALSLLALPPTAQASKNYQLFRLDTSFNFAYAYGPGRYGGGLTIEPKFSVLDQLVVGAQVGVAIFGGGSINPGAVGNSVSMSVGAILPFLAKVEYYPVHSPIRPFIGFGLGTYDVIGQTVGGMGIDQRVGFYFGLSPQVGIELGWFRLSVSYHALFGASWHVSQTLGAATPFDVSQNYVTFELGWRQWGNRRPPPPPPPAPPPGPMPAPPPGPAPAHP
jgi:hypothetical protein